MERQERTEEIIGDLRRMRIDQRIVYRRKQLQAVVGETELEERTRLVKNQTPVIGALYEDLKVEIERNPTCIGILCVGCIDDKLGMCDDCIMEKTVPKRQHDDDNCEACKKSMYGVADNCKDLQVLPFVSY